jgi:outer membrane protein
MWVASTLGFKREEPGRMLDRACALGCTSGRLACDQFVEPGELEASTFPKNPKEFKDPMISKFARFAAVVLGLSLIAFAQTNPAAAGQSNPGPVVSDPAASTPPNAPSAAAANAARPMGTKVGTINIEQAIFSSNEGQRDFQELTKKFEPKQNELKACADEIDGLTKQLNTQQDKLNDEAREKLVKQIETKKKSCERTQQDVQEDAQNQQGEIGNKILTKMAPLIVKYAGDNGYGMILDTSQQWPRGPVIWYGPAVDITQPVVEAYNKQSGVAAPPVGSTPARPVKPSTGTKPAAKPTTPPNK